MKLNKFFQLWSSILAKVSKKTKCSNRPSLITIELIAVTETETEHQERVQAVQVILIQMYLRLLKRGRPLKNEEENLYAA
jgi:predicted component of type VI protein secretion system